MLFPERVNCEVALFWTTPVTLEPITALIVVAAVPLPELVTVPMLLTGPVVTEMPFVLLLVSRVRLPVPETPDETVKRAAALAVSVVPPLFTFSAEPLMVSGLLVLAWVMAVTLEPTPPVIVFGVVPVNPVPLLKVIVPALFTRLVPNVI